MATKALAHWAGTLDMSSIPPSVKRAASRSLYNYLGCAIGGSKHETVTKAYNALRFSFGPQHASLFGSDGQTRADIQHAALLNGIASHVQYVT